MMNAMLGLGGRYGLRLAYLDGNAGIASAVPEGTGADPQKIVIQVADVRTGIVPSCFDPCYRTVEEALAAYRDQAITAALRSDRVEIDRMLTLSTGHLSPETRKRLEDNPEDDNLCITCYDKAGFGWYVYFAGLTETQIDGLPGDLRDCIRFAAANGCGVLCFDQDAVRTVSLPYFDDE